MPLLGGVERQEQLDRGELGAPCRGPALAQKRPLLEPLFQISGEVFKPAQGSHIDQYLNNIVEQDHRAIIRRYSWMTGFKSALNAAITISGIELAHRIRKRQFSFGPGTWPRSWSLKRVWQRALA
jgi:hypothetical protein